MPGHPVALCHHLGKGNRQGREARVQSSSQSASREQDLCSPSNLKENSKRSVSCLAWQEALTTLSPAGSGAKQALLGERGRIHSLWSLAFPPQPLYLAIESNCLEVCTQMWQSSLSLCAFVQGCHLETPAFPRELHPSKSGGLQGHQALSHI